MTDQLVIECGPAKEQHKRLVIARLGQREHTDRFDTDDAFRRTKFRETLIGKFNLGEDANEWLNDQIIAAADAEDASGGSIWTPNTVSLADVEEKPVCWFWQDYIPEGAYTVVDADPGEGKSTIAIDIGARYTRGDAMPPQTAPDGTYQSGNVLLLSAEDDLQRTIKPRLRAAGARMERVTHLRTASIDGDDDRIIQLPADTSIIERVIVEKKIGFIVVDVLSCFTQVGDSLNDEGAMRRLASQFSDMLERTRATALVLRHLNKKENLRSMYRGGGSIAIVAAARAAFAIAPHPDEPGVKVLAAVKHNLGPRPHSLTYEIEACGDTSRIKWGGQTDLTAADVLHPAKSERNGGKVGAAKSIIEDILAGGPRGENEIKRACLDAGASERTYWRARKSLGVLSEKTDFRGEWLLSLPSENGAPTE